MNLRVVSYIRVISERRNTECLLPLISNWILLISESVWVLWPNWTTFSSWAQFPYLPSTKWCRYSSNIQLNCSVSTLGGLVAPATPRLGLSIVACLRPSKAAWHSRFPPHWMSSSFNNSVSELAPFKNSSMDCLLLLASLGHERNTALIFVFSHHTLQQSSSFPP